MADHAHTQYISASAFTFNHMHMFNVIGAGGMHVLFLFLLVFANQKVNVWINLAADLFDLQYMNMFCVFEKALQQKPQPDVTQQQV